MKRLSVSPPAIIAAVAVSCVLGLSVGAQVGLQRGVLTHAGFLAAGSGAVLRSAESKMRDPSTVLDYGAKCDGTDEHAAIQRCITAEWECSLPGGLTCNAGSTTITVPTGHGFLGRGMRASTLKTTSSSCGFQVDNNDGGYFYHLTLSAVNVVSGTSGVCLTNVNGPTLRLSFEDVMIASDAPAGTFTATGAISATTLTVSVGGSRSIAIGAGVTGSGVTSGTFVSALGTGTGGAGTYTISPSQTVGSETLTFGTPPIPNTYGVLIHSTTGNSLYYFDFRHLVTVGWERGVESLGDTGSGGANANFFSAYSGNANTTGIYFDGFSGDNWVQGHCNGSGQNVTQNCVQMGDGTHNSAGNFLMGVTSDTGALGTAFKLFTPSGNNFVVATNESSALDFFNSDSTNTLLVNKPVGVAARHAFLPDLIVGGTTTLSSAVFIGGARRDTGTLVKTDTDYTLTQNDRTVCEISTTAPRTFTLTANAGQAVTLGDCDGTGITGTNTLTIARPSGGKINGAASNIVLAAAGKSAKCEPLVSSALNFSCTVSP